MAQRVRGAIKGTLCYDIHDELPVEEPFDCVICLLVLDTASRNLSDFEANLCKIASVLRGPGSTLIIVLINNESQFYTLAGKKYPSFNIESEMALSCLAKAEITCTNTSEHMASYEAGPIRKFLFVSAKLSA